MHGVGENAIDRVVNAIVAENVAALGVADRNRVLHELEMDMAADDEVGIAVRSGRMRDHAHGKAGERAILNHDIGRKPHAVLRGAGVDGPLR